MSFYNSTASTWTVATSRTTSKPVNFYLESFFGMMKIDGYENVLNNCLSNEFIFIMKIGSFLGDLADASNETESPNLAWR